MYLKKFRNVEDIFQYPNNYNYIISFKYSLNYVHNLFF